MKNAEHVSRDIQVLPYIHTGHTVFRSKIRFCYSTETYFDSENSASRVVYVGHIG